METSAVRPMPRSSVHSTTMLGVKPTGHEWKNCNCRDEDLVADILVEASVKRLGNRS
jgi:hypothetical protein